MKYTLEMRVEMDLPDDEAAKIATGIMLAQAGVLKDANYNITNIELRLLAGKREVRLPLAS